MFFDFFFILIRLSVHPGRRQILNLLLSGVIILIFTGILIITLYINVNIYCYMLGSWLRHIWALTENITLNDFNADLLSINREMILLGHWIIILVILLWVISDRIRRAIALFNFLLERWTWPNRYTIVTSFAFQSFFNSRFPFIIWYSCIRWV